MVSDERSDTCCAMTIGAGKPAGRWRSRPRMACTPPAEAAIATTSKLEKGKCRIRVLGYDSVHNTPDAARANPMECLSMAKNPVPALARQNALLAALPRAERARLAARMERVDLDVREH